MTCLRSCRQQEGFKFRSSYSKKAQIRNFVPSIAVIFWELKQKGAPALKDPWLKQQEMLHGSRWQGPQGSAAGWRARPRDMEGTGAERTFLLFMFSFSFE